QVCLVVRVGKMLDRDLVRYRQVISRHARDLLRVVGQDANARQTEVRQDLRADAIVAEIRRQPEAQVRVDGVQPLLLELVRAQLVEQADSSALLGQVEQHPQTFPFNHRQRRLELFAAVTAQRVEHVAGQ